jgi:Carbohydrate binding module (family 6).
MPEGAVSGLTDFTVATWVNPSAQSNWQRIWDFGTGQTAYMFLAVRSGTGATTNSPRFAITTSGGGGEQLITRSVPAPLPNNAWTHIAITKSGNTGTMYVNGEAVGTNPNMTLSPSSLGNTTQNWIGRSQYADPLLTAAIDEFQVYDHALSSDEIQSLMASPGGDTGGGNVAWYRFDEAGGPAATDSSGNERHASVVTNIVGSVLVPALDGFSSADPETNTVHVIFGGGEGDIQLKVNGLQALPSFGDQANVQVFTTEWTGTDGVSDGPVALFQGNYEVKKGSISVPIAGLNEFDAYLAVITPVAAASAFEGVVRRHEAEIAVLDSNNKWLKANATSPLASDNLYVTSKKAGGGQLTFIVEAPVGGAYDLDIRYSNASGSNTSGAVIVNGQPAEVISYEPTASVAPFATYRTHVVLHAGTNEIRLGLESGALSVDYVEVTPFRARLEAESGAWTGATLSVQDMAESNFFAVFFSNNAEVRNLNQATSNLRLPVTVPAAGTYQLKIGYSTAGNEAQRRAQIPSGHILRVNQGDWQLVTYAPTQFRDMIRQTTAVVELPAGTSTITLAKGDPSFPGGTQPGTVDLDYVDVELMH